MSAWQPIETAPQDGAWIMLCSRKMSMSDYPLVAWWDEGWICARSLELPRFTPTHWMPIPEPPTP